QGAGGVASKVEQGSDERGEQMPRVGVGRAGDLAGDEGHGVFKEIDDAPQLVQVPQVAEQLVIQRLGSAQGHDRQLRRTRMGGEEQLTHRIEPVLMVIFRAEQDARQPAMRLGYQAPVIQGGGRQDFEALVAQFIEEFVELLAGDIAAPAIRVDDQNREMQVLEHAASYVGSVTQCCAAAGPWQARRGACVASRRCREWYAAPLWVVLCRESYC